VHYDKVGWKGAGRGGIVCSMDRFTHSHGCVYDYSFSIIFYRISVVWLCLFLRSLLWDTSLDTLSLISSLQLLSVFTAHHRYLPFCSLIYRLSMWFLHPDWLVTDYDFLANFIFINNIMFLDLRQNAKGTRYP